LGTVSYRHVALSSVCKERVAEVVPLGSVPEGLASDRTGDVVSVPISPHPIRNIKKKAKPIMESLVVIGSSLLDKYVKGDNKSKECNLSISERHMAFRPCFATGLAQKN
jgi:hypothetical protein